jgi:hypothetical protein
LWVLWLVRHKELLSKDPIAVRAFQIIGRKEAYEIVNGRPMPEPESLDI